MPVRSGPTWPPSPPWRWHLAHCCRKTTLPAAASPPCRTSGASASITFWRSGSGRPPPCVEQPLGPSRRSPGSGGRPAPASGRATSSESGTDSVLEGVDQGRGPVGAARARRGSPGPATRARAPAGARPGHAPTSGDSLRRDGLDQAGGQLGRACRGVIRLEQLPRRSRRLADGARRAAGRRRAAAARRACSSLAVARSDAAISARMRSSASVAPGGSPAGTSCPRAAAGSSPWQSCSRRFLGLAIELARAGPWASRAPARRAIASLHGRSPPCKRGQESRRPTRPGRRGPSARRPARRSAQRLPADRLGSTCDGPRSP